MHFNAGAILPPQVTKTNNARQVGLVLDTLLFRFSDEFELDPYIEVCDCIVESRSFFKRGNKRYGKTDPSCETCNGTGKMKTTYNTFACFDWWEIGGNWDGDLAGITRKSNTLWRNCVVVRDLPKNYYFFALVTPNKKWHEQWHFTER